MPRVPCVPRVPRVPRLELRVFIEPRSAQHAARSTQHAARSMLHQSAARCIRALIGTLTPFCSISSSKSMARRQSAAFSHAEIAAE